MSKTSPEQSAGCCSRDGAADSTGSAYGLQDITRLGLFALGLQCLLLIPYIVMARVHKPDAQHIWWRVLDLVIYALPPGLPLVVLTMGSVARKRLKDIGLMLINPSILKLGAPIDIVCFDKTGALTASTVRFVYVVLFAAGTACAALRSEE